MSSGSVDLGSNIGGAGVTSLNSLTGALTLVAGSGITITPAGSNITITSTGGGGTVTSVALADSTGIFNISGSPVTTSGTLTLTSLQSQTAKTFLAAPNGSSGAPTFRLIVASDIPTLNQNTTGTASNITASSNSTLTTLSALSLPTTQLSGQVTLSQLPSIANNTVLGNVSGISAVPSALTTTQLTTLINAFSSTLSGAAPASGGGTSNFLRADGTWTTPGGSGTVTSVALSDGSSTPIYTISGSPVTTSGTLTLTLQTQTANKVFASPTSGGAAQPTFRALVAADIPSLSGIYLPLAGGTMSGSINMGNQTFVNASQVGIGTAAPASATSIDIVNTTGLTQRLMQTGYGGTVGTRNRYANGTLVSPTAATIGQNLGFISGQGYGATGFPANSTGAISFLAQSTFTDTSMPTSISMSTTPTGSVTPVVGLTLQPTGQLSLPAFYTTGGVLLNDSSGNITSTAGPLTVASGGTGAASFSAYSVILAGTTSTNPMQVVSGVGTFGQLLVSQGAATAPVWANGVSLYGDGSDGNVTVSAGTTTLTKDMYYNNLTINGTGAIRTNSWRIFVAGTLDLTAAPNGAIGLTVSNGGNSASQTGGTGGTGGGSGTTLAFGRSGAAGGTGVIGAGVVGTAGTAGMNGGSNGTSGNSGAGGPNAGGTAGAAGVAATAPASVPVRRYETNLITGIGAVTAIFGGSGGNSGAAGSGDGTTVGNSCGGGGGGSSAGVMGIWANTITRGGSTAVGAILGKGGNGGNGRSGAAAVATSGVGGGGGGSGGGGGWIYIAYNQLTGSTATNAIDVTGGNGGSGGNGFNGSGGSTAVGGNGGGSGGGGRITLFNVVTGVGSEVAPVVSVAGSAASGTTGGGGGTATTSQGSL